MKILKTKNIKDIKPFIDKLYAPLADSHKGQNGRVLVVGGSGLFHAASLWSAETASFFNDIVHYSSTKENNEVFLSLKKKFKNGIVVSRSNIDSYIEEDDAILVGPGMERSEYTAQLTKQIIEKHPNKRFVFDAGSLQMMKPDWLLKLLQPAVVTPHVGEFEVMFGQKIKEKPLDQKTKVVQEKANAYKCVIILKAVVDIVSDGSGVIVIEGGNAGLTKGGSGDILAGLILGLVSKNDPVTSSVLASYLLKKTSDNLFLTRGYWYNSSDIVQELSKTLAGIVFQKQRI